ncbi:MAG: MBL fold metallo-hydrolase [Patescibacteria group bacterium]|nr:MBL fold metallo-hydrolase [Patescibacteria group bacterium]MDP6756128.1 MBL fold metallo-hydrolase [Patescibacteria group bacterium]
MILKHFKQIILLAAGATSIAVTLSIILFVTAHARASQTEVIFLDVGQGDSVLIKTKYGQNILIDGGRDNRVLDRLGRNLSFFDRKFDMVIATHPDSDHIAGLIPVLERYQVDLLLDTGVLHDSNVFEAMREVIQQKQILVRFVESEQRYEFGEGVILDVLFPNKSFVDKDIDDNNAASIIVKFSDKEIDYIFTGDAPKEVEDELVNIHGIYLDSEVLKIGHHGSDTSSSDLFLSMVTPEVAIIQVGKDNRYNHPSFRVLRRLQDRSIPVLRNDEMGDIRFVSDGEFVEMR